MNIPIQLGLPQIFLLLIALIAIILLVWAAKSLIVGEVAHHEDEEGRAYWRKFGRRLRRRHFHWGRTLTGIILLLLASSMLWMTLLVQSYVELTSDIKVATIQATTFANAPHLMSVDLTMLDQSGKEVSNKTYVVNGDEWMLEGDIIKFPPLLNILGLHSGYKITRLEGRYDDPNLELHGPRTVVTLNGGDDGFFKTVQETPWSSPIVQAAYGNAVFLAADGKTYGIYVSQSGLYAQPESS